MPFIPVEDLPKQAPSGFIPLSDLPPAPPAPPKTALQSAGDAGGAVLNGLGDLAIGAAKGAIDTPREFASLGTHLGNYLGSNSVGRFVAQNILRPLIKSTGVNTDRLNAAVSGAGAAQFQGVAQTPLTTPTNTAQKVGFGAEKVAEAVALPQVTGATVARVPTTAGAFPYLVNLGERVALSAGLSGGIAAYQTGGENPEAVKIATIAGGVFPLLGEAARGLGYLGKAVFKTAASALSGAPTKTIEYAFQNPDEVQNAVHEMANDPQGAQTILKHAKEDWATIKEARDAVYQIQLDDLKSQNLPDLPMDGLKSDIQGTIEDIGRVQVNSDGGIDVTKRSLLPKSMMNDLADMWDRINTWDTGKGAQGTDPVSLNELRQVVDSYYRPTAGNSSDVRVFNKIVTQASQAISDYAESNAPELGTMNQNYAAESKVLKNIDQELRIKGNATMAMRKLLNVFNPKQEVYQPLVEQLGQKAADNLMTDVAGLTLSRWTPEGLAKYLATIGVGSSAGIGSLVAGAAHAIAPEVIGTAALASPRIVGAIATNAGKAAPVVEKVANAVAPAVASQIGIGAAQEDYRPTSDGMILRYERGVPPTAQDLRTNTFDWNGGTYRLEPDNSLTLLRGRPGAQTHIPASEAQLLEQSPAAGQ